MLSIIIPVLNDNEELNLTIKSIRDTTANDNVEIIVVDDGSDIPVIVQDVNVKLFRFDVRKGVGQSRHFGAIQSTRKHLLFIDSHMRFVVGWYENAISKIINTPKTLWCGACLGLNSSMMNVDTPIGIYTGADLVLYRPYPNIVFDGIWKRDIANDDNYEISCVMGACYFIHKDWFFYIKGLEHAIMWGSDEPILSVKSWLAGGEVRLMKSVKIGHKFRDVSPYSTNVSHLYYNKLAYMYMLFPIELYEKMLTKFRDDGNKFAALDLVKQNKNILDSEKEYYKSIFTRDINWLCNKFNIEVPK